VADAADVQVAITRTRSSRSGFEDTIAATKGRGLCAFHTEGAGGGRRTFCGGGRANFLPSSTNPTMPYRQHSTSMSTC
jgi:urease subunit alpha